VTFYVFFLCCIRFLEQWTQHREEMTSALPDKHCGGYKETTEEEDGSCRRYIIRFISARVGIYYAYCSELIRAAESRQYSENDDTIGTAACKRRLRGGRSTNI